jgi:hypothetical protein
MGAGPRQRPVDTLAVGAPNVASVANGINGDQAKNRLSGRYGRAAIRRVQRRHDEPFPRIPVPGRSLIHRTAPNIRTGIASSSGLADGDAVLSEQPARLADPNEFEK